MVRPYFEFTGDRHGLEHESAERVMQKPNERPTRRVDVLKEADRLIMSRYAPAGMIINAELQIVQFRGHTGPFLEPSPGEASLHILKMAPEGLLFELRTAIDKSKKTNEPVRADGIRLRDGERFREVSIEVIPLRDGREGETAAPTERCFLVLFEEKPNRATDGASNNPTVREKAKPTAKGTRDHHLARLEQELLATKEYLQAIIEEQEATNEDLQSFNEELLSSNEELQSINEELETAKEELQSTNEELTTVNEELEGRNAELGQFADDLGNLLASVNIPIVMLDSDLRIRHFTPQAERVLKVIPSDLGRPIGDLKQKVNVPDLERLILDVIERVSIYEREVQDHEGRWYSLRIQPYRAAGNRIEGAVICLVDIDNMKRSLDGDGRPQTATEMRG
jgi:two-component system, chemotaxis family, CheB/CheR fusion protein